MRSLPRTMKTFKPGNLIPLGISVLLVGLLFAWQGNKGFSLGDEGFLWYGAQRVMLGEVPIRDFMAYDPGRYYWSAAIMNVLGGNGIINLRIASGVFQALGLFAGTILIFKLFEEKQRDWLYLAFSSLILSLWFYPRFKSFDISMSILLIYALTRFIEAPTVKNYFITGIWIGLAAVFGRNHGMYGVAGCLGVIVWLNLKRNLSKDWLKEWVAWAAGIVAGFLPVIYMLLFIPGFWPPFWQSILFLFDQRSTNLPLPIPWPWLVDYASLSFLDGMRAAMLGLYFVGLLLFGSISLGFVFYKRLKNQSVPASLVASAFLAFPYAQYAFSRADAAHLAQGIYPLLIGSLSLLAARSVKAKWLLLVGLLVTGFGVMYAVQPGWQCITGKCVEVEIAGDVIRVRPAVKRDLDLIKQMVDEYAPNGRSFLAVPLWPGAYAMMERRSPMWENYSFFPRTPEFEQTEVERIKDANPGVVIIWDYALDGQDMVRFKNTHPVVTQFVMDNFTDLPTDSDSDILIYVSGQ